jgi:hypothetical protein
LKRVFSSHNLQLVHHWKNVLAAEGIGARVRNEMLSSAMGELPPAECQAELWVDDADFAKAQAALSAFPAGEDWRCACGETLGAQFTDCWRCGRARSAR